MKPAVLVTPLSQEIPHVDHADYIGVDAGCLQILEQGFPLAFGVGDFDSMDPKMLEKLKTKGHRLPFIRFKRMKPIVN